MRATGKTFRAVLRSLQLASTGSNIFFACPTLPAVDYTFRMAAHIASCLAGVEIKKHKIDFYSVSHPGGWIEFVTYEKLNHMDNVGITRGIKNLEVITD